MGAEEKMIFLNADKEREIWHGQIKFIRQKKVGNRVETDFKWC